ncbi:putative 1-deoxy-D-xylulose-5-phosphate synthase, chloroplastic isoform X2 [Gossypium australe]|uniref:Putative 1-deoxy-D-xylulose-5-phosphate synthase, chloroplastic isoform X2 n=1 Tax=Gossypium australe TaxID=47621 RepID=A0A5B6VNC7_9ROSI|nr:putative 1-deoxy-D-xylulose-5-phosphate synthase, chloroplastic isoform X2 [Gossypium australe]
MLYSFPYWMDDVPEEREKAKQRMNSGIEYCSILIPALCYYKKKNIFITDVISGPLIGPKPKLSFGLKRGLRLRSSKRLLWGFKAQN